MIPSRDGRTWFDWSVTEACWYADVLPMQRQMVSWCNLKLPKEIPWLVPFRPIRFYGNVMQGELSADSQP